MSRLTRTAADGGTMGCTWRRKVTCSSGSVKSPCMPRYLADGGRGKGRCQGAARLGTWGGEAAVEQRKGAPPAVQRRRPTNQLRGLVAHLLDDFDVFAGQLCGAVVLAQSRVCERGHRSRSHAGADGRTNASGRDEGRGAYLFRLEKLGNAACQKLLRVGPGAPGGGRGEKEGEDMGSESGSLTECARLKVAAMALRVALHLRAGACVCVCAGVRVWVCVYEWSRKRKRNVETTDSSCTPFSRDRDRERKGLCMRIHMSMCMRVYHLYVHVCASPAGLTKDRTGHLFPSSSRPFSLFHPSLPSLAALTCLRGQCTSAGPRTPLLLSARAAAAPWLWPLTSQPGSPFSPVCVCVCVTAQVTRPLVSFRSQASAATPHCARPTSLGAFACCSRRSLCGFSRRAN